MSMILIAWKFPLVPDACAAEVLLRRWYKRDDDRELYPSPNVVAFAEALLRRHPELGDPQLAFEQTDRIVQLDLAGSIDSQVLDDILDLAREHELLVYDPQSGDVHRPGDPAEADKMPPGRPADAIKAVAMFAAI